nr:MAG TPA: Rifin [Caudoviricetes sp.]
MNDIFQSLLLSFGVTTFIFAILAIIFIVLILIDDKYK